MDTVTWINYDTESVTPTKLIRHDSTNLEIKKFDASIQKEALYMNQDKLSDNINGKFYLQNDMIFYQAEQKIDVPVPVSHPFPEQFRKLENKRNDILGLESNSCIPAYILYPDKFEMQVVELSLHYRNKKVLLYATYDLFIEIYDKLVDRFSNRYIYKGPDIDGVFSVYTFQTKPDNYNIRFIPNNNIIINYGNDFLAHIVENKLIVTSYFQ